MSRGTTVSVKHKREMLRHSLMGLLCACGALQGCSASGRPLFQSVGEVPTANANTPHAAHEGAQFITETPETRQVQQPAHAYAGSSPQSHAHHPSRSLSSLASGLQQESPAPETESQQPATPTEQGAKPPAAIAAVVGAAAGADIAADSGNSTTPTNPPPPPSTGSSSPQNANIAPIIVASVVATLVALLVLVAFIILKRRREDAKGGGPSEDELMHAWHAHELSASGLRHPRSRSHPSRGPSFSSVETGASRLSMKRLDSLQPGRCSRRSTKTSPQKYNEAQYAASSRPVAGSAGASFSLAAAAQHAHSPPRPQPAQNEIHPCVEGGFESSTLVTADAAVVLKHAPQQQAARSDCSSPKHPDKGIDEGALNAAYARLPQVSNTFMSGGVSSLNSLTVSEVKPWQPRTEAPTRPADSSLKACMKFMHEQLDCFGGDILLLRKYALLGNKERRAGGTALVQFARGTVGTGLDAYALKFFAHRSTYDEETRLYQSFPKQLRRFMPVVVQFVPNTDQKVRDPFGNALAPFIVMEKGESLRDRANNCRVDLFTAAQVLGHISQRIAELHSVGFAHRDLKPGNIMWQPRTYTWVLIDFGLTAKIGESAPLGCTPTYAAPETVAAVVKAQKYVVADAAVDAWALGVMAFELLVERPAFGMFASKPQVYVELTDPSNLLPWEKGRITREDMNKMGMFRQPILELLHRDPAQRATAEQFCRRITKMYEHHTETLTRTAHTGETSLQDGPSGLTPTAHSSTRYFT